jgi:S1-C subfamily serine protease/uncharacterized RDD family membrane protein YckC
MDEADRPDRPAGSDGPARPAGPGEAAWYYAREGRAVGPLSEQELLGLAARNALGRETLVWTQGLDAWRPAREVPALAAALPPPPAVPPPLPPETQRARAILQAVLTPGPGPATRAWLRFFARQLDYALVGLAAGLVAVRVRPDVHDTTELLVALAALALFVPIEALLLAAFGTTPGKWLFQIRVRDAEGRRLGLAAAMSRSVSVWWRGMGAGLPVISLVTLLFAYHRLRHEGIASWDRDGGVVVSHESFGPSRLAAVLATLACSVVLAGAITAWREQQALERALSARLQEVSRDVEARGASVKPSGESGSGSLASGATQHVSLKARKGELVGAVAVCDADCSDLDLRLLDSDGEELSADEESDARPVVAWRADADGPVTLEVSMRHCSVEPCRFAWQRLTFSGDAALAEDTGSGTCFAVAPDGAILTAHHVVDRANKITVQFAGSDPIPARLERDDPEHDLALLRVAEPTPHWLPLAPPHSARLGEPVFTLGFPVTDMLGDDPKYTDGAISALSGLEGRVSELQISVPIQPGSSGGPLVDAEGQVVGIVTSMAENDEFKRESGTMPQNVNWAVKSELAELLFEPPPRPPASARGHDAVVEQVRRAVCLVDVE